MYGTPAICVYVASMGQRNVLSSKSTLGIVYTVHVICNNFTWEFQSKIANIYDSIDKPLKIICDIILFLCINLLFS